MFRSPRRRKHVATTEQAATVGHSLLQPAPELLGSDLFRPEPPKERLVPADDGLFDSGGEASTVLPVEDTAGLFVPFDDVPRVEVSEAEANDPFACFDLPPFVTEQTDDGPSPAVRAHQAMLPRWRGRVLTD